MKVVLNSSAAGEMKLGMFFNIAHIFVQADTY